MEPDYIVVQCGGKGTRMAHLTRNKPKALVPVDNLPMLFHLFRRYPKKKFIIIGDYKYDVLCRYLETFADVAYQMVSASGSSGTCAGMQEAIHCMPDGCPFMMIWSDLILPDSFSFPKEPNNYIGIAKDFTCRWKFEDGVFAEERSSEFGVAGLFIFQNRELLKNVPYEGEFVCWLGSRTFKMLELPLYGTKEYGLFEEYNKQNTAPKCRPFNRIIRNGNIVLKQGIDQQGRELAKRERAWYQVAREQKIEQIPQIYSLDPLVMEWIDGENVYTKEILTAEEKRQILTEIVGCLKNLHSLKKVPADAESYYEAYIEKTFSRLKKVAKLIPFAQEKEVIINGKVCRNVLFMKEKIEKMVQAFFPQSFCFIHGDCTFSNIMLCRDNKPILIDPRGYFGHTELYGDSAYDWAKLYYSLVGNYDQFNLKRFSLEIQEKEVRLEVESNHWENMESLFFELLEDEVCVEQIKLFHAIIWLSLTTYAWENYDSICGAFYNGLLYLEEIL